MNNSILKFAKYLGISKNDFYIPEKSETKSEIEALKAELEEIKEERLILQNKIAQLEKR